MVVASFRDGVYVVDDGYQVEGILLPIILAGLVPNVAVRSVAVDLALPADAVVDRAVFSFTASPGGTVVLSSVGDVRAGTASTEVVVDLGAMTTVHSVAASPTPSVMRWNGVGFVAAGAGEIQSERLQLTFSQPVDPVTIGRTGSLQLPAVPEGLELVVNGVTAWSERQGSSPGLTPPSGSPKAFSVDLTDPVKRARSGAGPVRVELRSLTPGRLDLGLPEVTFHRVHPVAFPEGPTRTLTADSEGPFTLELPLPPESSGWEILAVDLVASGSPGPERVAPPVGPTFSPDARLRLKAGRLLWARLDTVLAGLGGRTTGVRVALRGGVDGGEVTGRLLADVDGRPGDPVAELTPVTVDPGDIPIWITLRAGRPVPTERTWLELGLTYGTAQWELTGEPSPAASAAVHVAKPGGALRPLTELDPIGTLWGAARLVTEPSDNRPIGALGLGLDPASGPRIELTPTSDGVAARFAADPPVAVVDGVLRLHGTVSVPGTVAFAAVNVTYRETTS